MKDIYKKIFISPLFLLIIFLSLISGLFKDVIALFLIIIIHEMGHVFLSFLYGWKIKRIDIGICGGFITYDDVIDKPFKEEIIISLAGFLFQAMFFTVYFALYNINVLNESLFILLNKYNISIFIFNVLPIYPLDGSKLLLVVLNLFLPYKKTLKLINAISFINIVLIIVLIFIFNVRFEYSYVMIACFIISKIINFTKDIPHLFNRFLFERYVNKTKSNNLVYIKGLNLSLLRRQKKHYFLIGKHYYSERKILSKKFD